MTHDDQMPFDHPDLVANPEPRCACLLLLDTSGSMQGRPVAELNEGLLAFKDELMADGMAAQRVEVGIISFGRCKSIRSFRPRIPGLRLISPRKAILRWEPPSS